MALCLPLPICPSIYHLLIVLFTYVSTCLSFSQFACIPFSTVIYLQPRTLTYTRTHTHTHTRARVHIVITTTNNNNRTTFDVPSTCAYEPSLAKRCPRHVYHITEHKRLVYKGHHTVYIPSYTIKPVLSDLPWAQRRHYRLWRDRLTVCNRRQRGRFVDSDPPETSCLKPGGDWGRFHCYT